MVCIEGRKGLDGTSWRGRRDDIRRFSEEIEEEELPASMVLENPRKDVKQRNKSDWTKEQIETLQSTTTVRDQII